MKLHLVSHHLDSWRVMLWCHWVLGGPKTLPYSIHLESSSSSPHSISGRSFPYLQNGTTTIKTVPAIVMSTMNLSVKPFSSDEKHCILRHLEKSHQFTQCMHFGFGPIISCGPRIMPSYPASLRMVTLCQELEHDEEVRRCLFFDTSAVSTACASLWIPIMLFLRASGSPLFIECEKRYKDQAITDLPESRDHFSSLFEPTHPSLKGAWNKMTRQVESGKPPPPRSVDPTQTRVAVKVRQNCPWKL
eukprot:PhF_6_TR34444/c0_g1_i1/m.50304